ncbi:MAG: photosystem P840 reaction-center cytochrome c-551 [Verrucomicrobia bacterium]|nr:photosystem P840 reaction-center cytochrome c-551 [Verrucomicrobiota bacterium]
MNRTRLAFVMVGGVLMSKFLIDFFAASPSSASLDQSKALFQNRCSQCHGLNQADNLDSYLPSNVQKLVERMQHMPGSGISSEEAQQIYEYLVYEYTKTHKNELDAELKALPDDKRKEEQAKIDEIAAKF